MTSRSLRAALAALAACALAAALAVPAAAAAPANATTGAVAAVAAGKVSVDQYVHDLCVDFAAWRKKLAKISKAYSASSTSIGSVDDLRTATTTFFDKAGSQTEKLASQLGGIGTPKTANGSKIATALTTAISQVADAFHSAATDVRNIVATDLSAFATELQTISDKSQQDISAAGEAFTTIGSRYRSAGFDKAEKSDPACKPLRNS
jgi:HPt (histidine-containing phosphotransfer) domain-containing protein